MFYLLTTPDGFSATFDTIEEARDYRDRNKLVGAVITVKRTI